MDNPRLNAFSEDIDARLASFKEESFEDIKNSPDHYSFNTNDKNVENQHLIYNKRSSGAKEQREGFANNNFHYSSDSLRNDTQSFEGKDAVPQSNHLEDNFTLESNVPPADSFKQRVKFRKQEEKHFQCLQSKISSYATPASLSQPIACNTQRDYPNDNINFQKEEFEIKNPTSLGPYEQKYEIWLNEDPSYELKHHSSADLDVSYRNKVHKDKLFLSCDNSKEIDCDVDFVTNRNVKIPRDFEEIHGKNKYLFNYSRYNDLKINKNVFSNSDFRLVSKREQARRLKTFESSSNSYAAYYDRKDVELKDNICFQQKNVKGVSNFGRKVLTTHQSNDHKVTPMHGIDNSSCNEMTSDLSDLEIKRRNYLKSNKKKSVSVHNPSTCNDDSEINQIHWEDIGNDFKVKRKSDVILLGDAKTDMAASKHIENQFRLESNENINIETYKLKTSDNEIWKSENAHIDIRRRKRKSAANTLTMIDAQRIAPLVLKDITDDKSFQNKYEDFTSDLKENASRIRRKCWAKQCWSNTIHSHVANISKDLNAWKNRNAIVNSLKSPQNYVAQSKKKTCADRWSSFLKLSASRFQLWNSTLKKIEGQFGTGVVSYFVFLRWLILLNFVIFTLYFLLILLPYSAFALMPQQNVQAPNQTLFTKEYLDKFPKYENIPISKKKLSFENVSLNLDQDLLSNLGTLLDNYAADEIIDIATRYDKRNYTSEERYNRSLICNERYRKEMDNHTTETFSFLQDFLQGTGWLQSTVLFLGFYPDRDVSYFGLKYNLSIAFLAVLIVSFFLSLVLMLHYSSHGIEESILTQKSSYLTFSNILFCSWDYCIEDKKTADIRHKSITCEMKSNLAEEHRKIEVSRWSSKKRLKVYVLRAVVNILVIAALFGCFYLIYIVVNLQLEKQRQKALNDSGMYTLFIQFLPPLVITGLNIIMPIIFSVVVKLEMYSAQTQVNIALFRIVFLRLASVFVLVSSLYQQITCEPKDSCRAGMTKFCRSPICWETYVGQQLYKLAITDFLVYICMFLVYDLPRDFIVQRCKCKITEVVGRQVFDLPSQVLSLVYSQTLCWLGLFYSPILPGISVLKFLIIFYLKKIVVLKHCAPSPVLYKASRTNSIFMTILMLSLFVVTMIHGYCLTSVEPSPGCSPFRQYWVMIHSISDAIKYWSTDLITFMNYLFSGFFFIPAFLLLILIIYYYWTIVVAHRKMAKILKAQIAVEGRDKQFLLNRLTEAARQITAN